jgi:hypothetical protein
MVTAAQSKAESGNGKSSAKKPNGTAGRQRHSGPKANAARKRKVGSGQQEGLPAWLTAAVSVIGVGVAVGAGLYATRRQWMSKAEEWRNEFSAAFADDETDHENFDQTRGAGVDAMRDHPGDDWEDIDDMSDASFPASDPPSFTPGVA